jgi:hypothetical protein
MDRRTFLQLGLGATLCGGTALLNWRVARLESAVSGPPPAFSIVPVVGDGKWIWTGVHELVLQKGDHIRVLERGKYFRLVEHWMQWGGRRPGVRYTGKLLPQPTPTSPDAGPGAREKAANGDWKLTGAHPLDRYARQ